MRVIRRDALAVEKRSGCFPWTALRRHARLDDHLLAVQGSSHDCTLGLYFDITDDRKDIEYRRRTPFSGLFRSRTFESKQQSTLDNGVPTAGVESNFDQRRRRERDFAVTIRARQRSARIPNTSVRRAVTFVSLLRVHQRRTPRQLRNTVKMHPDDFRGLQ